MEDDLVALHESAGLLLDEDDEGEREAEAAPLHARVGPHQSVGGEQEVAVLVLGLETKEIDQLISDKI